MNTKITQFPAMNPNPALSVANDWTVLYSNRAGEPLLREWGVAVGEKLPSYIGDIVKNVISLNSPEKTEVNVGNRVYLFVFHPLPEQECVNISGFDISDQGELEEKLRESENKYRNIVETSVEGIWIFNAVSETTYVNQKIADMLGYKPEEMIGRFIWDFAYDEDKDIFQVKLANRKQGIDEIYELKLLRKDGSPLWISVSAKGFFNDAGKFEGSVGMFTDITEHKQAEKMLDFERSQLLSIFDGMDDMVYVADPYTYEILYANKTMKEKFDGEYVGEICYRKLQRRDSPCDFCTNPTILKDMGKPYRWEYYNFVVDRFFMITDRIIKWPDGRDVRLEIAKDITERKRAEQALKKAHDTLEEKIKERTAELQEAYNSLKESEERLAEAQEMSHLGNWNWNIVTNRVHWSDETYRIFGCSPQEFSATYEAFLSYVHPDDREHVNNAIKEALSGNSYCSNYRIIQINGEERIVHTQGEVIFDEKSIPIQMKGIVQDITIRKKAEEALRESEEKYRNIVETANEGISIIDTEERITFVNKQIEDMFGYSSEELIGRPMWDFLSDESKAIIKQILHKGWENVNESLEIKFVRKDGSLLWTHTNSKSLLDKDGKFFGTLNLHTDITKRKEVEEALRSFEIARKKEIHHRVKNNLQVIYSLLDLQADMFKGRESIRDSEVLSAFTESQDRIISIALIHEELYKGKNIDVLNFSQYIKELAENLLLTYRLENNISLNLDVEENILYDLDTAIPLGIIVNELVSNSLKHAFQGRDKGLIQIKLHRDENRESKNEDFESFFVMKVSDNGVGIPEIFEIEDLDSLGMQLVASLVDQLDGELELKKDNGTEFTIRFTVTEKNNNTLDPASQLVE
jgi:PAS domain S-box-containing protein